LGCLKKKNLPLRVKVLCSANWTGALDRPAVVHETLNLIKHCVRYMFDYLPDLNFFFSSNVIAAIGKKQRTVLPEQL